MLLLHSSPYILLRPNGNVAKKPKQSDFFFRLECDFVRSMVSLHRKQNKV